jgi:hypothetical protein
MVSRSAKHLLPCALFAMASSIAFAQNAGVTAPVNGSPRVGDMGTSAARQADRAMESDSGAASAGAGESSVTHGQTGTSAHDGNKTHDIPKQRSGTHRPGGPAKSTDDNTKQPR